MNTYRIGSDELDSVELKCLVVSRGVKVDNAVYRQYACERLSVSPLHCNCMILSDGTIVQLTDMGFHLKYLNGMLSWDNLKLLKYASQLGTPFAIKLVDGKAALTHDGAFVDFVSFPKATDFYQRRTASGLPYTGNAVLQGVDWVAFQCLWSCEYASCGRPCEFCFSGAAFESLATKGKTQPAAVRAEDVREIVAYAMEHVDCSHVQLTGGSTFEGASEAAYIRAYLAAIRGLVPGEVLLYITPPEDEALIDEYFSLGASRMAFSIEVWDLERARRITPGKVEFATRQRYLDRLGYVAGKYGPGRAFSNFIIGIEPFETLREGATALAERGVMPTASIWMPMGRPVMGTMQAPDLDFFRRVKELFAGLYAKYHLEPTDCCGLNVCMERDIWRFGQGV